jgi:hypothetical protein
LEESGVITAVSQPLLSLMRARIERNEPCSLQYLDFDNVRLGMCASASLIERSAQGEIPAELTTNEGIRNIFWLRLMRQLAFDCLTRAGGSLTSSRAASELLGISAEKAQGLARIAHEQGLISFDDTSALRGIRITHRLITTLHNRELTKLFENVHHQRSLSSVKRSTLLSSLTETTPTPAPMEKLVLPKHEPISKDRRPRQEKLPSTEQFADLYASIRAVFNANAGKWLAPVEVWNLVRTRGDNPRSPGRVRDICRELRSSGFLRRSNDGTFQITRPAPEAQ